MKKILILFLALLVFSCSVQQRKYRKGYHIVWHKHNSFKDHPGVLALNGKPLVRPTLSEISVKTVRDDASQIDANNTDPATHKIKKNAFVNSPRIRTKNVTAFPILRTAKREEPKVQNRMAVYSFGFGLFSCFFSCFILLVLAVLGSGYAILLVFPLITGIIAISTGLTGLYQIAEDHEEHSGESKAMTGVMEGMFILVICGLILLLLL